MRVTRQETGQHRQGVTGARVVLHGAGTQRVKLGIDGKVFLRQARVVTHHLHLGDLRQAGCLRAQEFSRNIGAVGDGFRSLCQCTAACMGLFKYQHVIYSSSIGLLQERLAAANGSVVEQFAAASRSCSLFIYSTASAAS